MVSQETHEVERKVVAILRVLSGSSQPLGGRVIARRLNDLGIDLGERAVRYHLKLMDERGFTYPIGRKDGRLITESGLEELGSALVGDRIGSVAAKIESLAYQSSFDPERLTGQVPVSLSLFTEEGFGQAIAAMKEAFEARLGVSDLLAVAYQGEQLGEVIVPQGKVGLAMVSNIVFHGVLLKAGIPVDAEFGGLIEIRNHQPLRFVDLIEYKGSSLDPSEVLIAGKMTSISKVIREGNGKMLGSFGEIPALALPKAKTALKQMETAGVRGLVILGRIGESVCELPVAVNKVGMVLADGLNPVAAAVEAGVSVVNHATSGVIDFEKLRSFRGFMI